MPFFVAFIDAGLRSLIINDSKQPCSRYERAFITNGVVLKQLFIRGVLAREAERLLDVDVVRGGNRITASRILLISACDLDEDGSGAGDLRVARPIHLRCGLDACCRDDVNAPDDADGADERGCGRLNPTAKGFLLVSIREVDAGRPRIGDLLLRSHDAADIRERKRRAD